MISIRAQGLVVNADRVRSASLTRKSLNDPLLTGSSFRADVHAAVWLVQERLVFYPQPIHGAPRPPAGWRLEEFRHRTADGTTLAGVLVLPPRERPPLVIYFVAQNKLIGGAHNIARHDN